MWRATYPHAGDLYVFRGRSGSLIKILWHDGIGMSLYAKRLERELPAGYPEVLPIRVALLTMAGKHLQTLTTIFAGGDEYSTNAVSPLAMGSQS
jgi:IS66 Orf2 like protein